MQLRVAPYVDVMNIITFSRGKGFVNILKHGPPYIRKKGLRCPAAGGWVVCMHDDTGRAVSLCLRYSDSVGIEQL